MVEDRKEGFSTTFWQDFSIADRFGVKAVRDTYSRAFNEWRDNYLYLTDLVLVLNQKIWQHFEYGRTELAKAYNDMWQEAEEYAYSHLGDAEIAYFVRVLD